MNTADKKEPSFPNKELPQDQGDDFVKEERDAEVGQNEEPKGDRPGPSD